MQDTPVHSIDPANVSLWVYIDHFLLQENDGGREERYGYSELIPTPLHSSCERQWWWQREEEDIWVKTQIKMSESFLFYLSHPCHLWITALVTLYEALHFSTSLAGSAACCNEADKYQTITHVIAPNSSLSHDTYNLSSPPFSSSRWIPIIFNCSPLFFLLPSA